MVRFVCLTRLRWLVRLARLRRFVRLARLRWFVRLAWPRWLVRLARLRWFVCLARLRWLVRLAWLRWLVRFAWLRWFVRFLRAAGGAYAVCVGVRLALGARVGNEFRFFRKYYAASRAHLLPRAEPTGNMRLRVLSPDGVRPDFARIRFRVDARGQAFLRTGCGQVEGKSAFGAIQCAMIIIINVRAGFGIRLCVNAGGLIPPDLAAVRALRIADATARYLMAVDVFLHRLVAPFVIDRHVFMRARRRRVAAVVPAFYTHRSIFLKGGVRIPDVFALFHDALHRQRLVLPGCGATRAIIVGPDFVGEGMRFAVNRLVRDVPGVGLIVTQRLHIVRADVFAAAILAHAIYKDVGGQIIKIQLLYRAEVRAAVRAGQLPGEVAIHVVCPGSVVRILHLFPDEVAPRLALMPALRAAAGAHAVFKDMLMLIAASGTRAVFVIGMRLCRSALDGGIGDFLGKNA